MAALLSSVHSLAQTTVTSGAGAPTLGCASSSNYGSLYTNTTTNTVYACTAAGWILQISGFFVADPTNTTQITSAVSTWITSTTYPPCSRVSDGSGNYYITGVQSSGHAPTTSPGQNEWILLTTSSQPNPYAIDCLWAAAVDYTISSGNSATVIVPPGNYNTGTGFQQYPNGNGWPTVSMVGAGLDSSVITLQASLSDYMWKLNDNPGSSTSATANLVGVTLNANEKATGVVYWSANRRSRIIQNHFLGSPGTSAGTTYPMFQLGGPTHSGYYTVGDQITMADNWFDGGGSGTSVAGNPAQLTTTVSAGIPSAAVKSTGFHLNSTSVNLNTTTGVLTFTGSSNTMVGAHQAQVTGCGAGNSSLNGKYFPVTSFTATTVVVNYSGSVTNGPDSCVVTQTYGGHYRYGNATNTAVLLGYGKGGSPCSTMTSPTITPTFTPLAAPSTYYTITGVSIAGYSNCSDNISNGGIDTVVFDLPAATYGLLLSNTTDSYFYKNVGSGIGTSACVHNDNSANTFVAMHCDDNITNYEDAAGGSWFGTDCDSALVNWHLVNIGGGGSTATGFRSDSCHMYYDSSVQYPHATVYLIDQGVTNVSVGPDSIISSSQPADYYPIVMSGSGTGTGPIQTPNGPTPTQAGTLPSGFVSLSTPEASPAYMTTSSMALAQGSGTISIGTSRRISSVQGSSAQSLMGATGPFTTGDLLSVGTDGSAVDAGLAPSPSFLAQDCLIASTTTAPALCSARWTMDRNAILTRFQIEALTPPGTCGTPAQYEIYDSTTSVGLATLTMNSPGTGHYNTGLISKSVAAGDILYFQLLTAAATCSTYPANVSMVAQFN